MAYSITKPNIYFNGDKRILTETVAGSVSKFNVVMTHAKDSMYYVIDNSTKDTIEIAIEPFKTDTNCVLTNYIMFPNNFSGKTISFVAPDGYEIYYTGDYTRAKYTENTIIAIQHVDMGKIVVTINAGEKTEKYGVLLTLETTAANETVNYLDDRIIDVQTILSNVQLYWDYNLETDTLGTASHNNSKTYETPGIHHLVVLSNDNLQFTNHCSLLGGQLYDISQYLIKISKFKNYEPKLIYKNYSPSQGYTDLDIGYYFSGFDKLKEIKTNDIFDTNITNFTGCFEDCTSLELIPNGLFDNNREVTSFSRCFEGCSSLQSIPNGLFDNNREVTNFNYCFGSCTLLQSIPNGLFDNNGKVTDFTSCFHGCSSLTSIPGSLFNSNTAVTSFNYCFGSCITLELIPNELFDNNIEVTDFTGCFNHCRNITSNVPDLWNKSKWPNVKLYGRCFYNCINAANYYSIPDDWKH